MKNKFMFALMGLASAPLAVLAEGEGSGSTLTQVTTLLNDGKSALQELLTQGLPIVGGIIGAGLTIWAGFKLIRLLMKAFGFGSSR